MASAEAPPAPPPRAAGADGAVTEPGGRRRLRPALIVVAVLLGVLAGLGALLLVGARGERADADAYRSAPRCQTVPVAVPQDCWVGVLGNVAGVDDGRSRLGRRTSTVSVRGADGGVVPVAVLPTTTLSCIHPGDAAELKSWRGNVTTVFTAHGSVPALASPLLNDQLRLEGGITLCAVVALVPLGVLLDRSRRRRGARSEPLEALLRRRSVRVALGAFVVGQLVDVVTSAMGYDRGLVEANQLVAAVVDVVGPLGFLLSRLPVLALFLLGLSRVPRHALLAVLWSVGVVFAASGAHNLLLVVEAAAPTCAAASLP